MNLESLEELLEKIWEGESIEACRNYASEILRRDKEKDLSNNEILFDKFSQSFVVNKWTPESCFDNPLDYYIHEIWKRDPVVVEKDERIKELENAYIMMASEMEAISDYILKDIDPSDFILSIDNIDELVCTIAGLKQHAETTEAKVKDMQCCGNCEHYNSHECYCFHNWEAYKRCNDEGKYKWTFATRTSDNLAEEERK